jgi:hypothetical protein
MWNQKDILAIVICAVCAAGCGVVDPAGGELDGQGSEQDGEPEDLEELGITTQEAVGMGHLPMNTPKTVHWAGCSFVVQHGVFIFTPYAKVRTKDCTCIVTPIATVVYEGAGVDDWEGDPDNCSSEWNQVTVPLGFGPRLIGSKYVVIPANIRNAATLAFTIFQ